MKRILVVLLVLSFNSPSRGQLSKFNTTITDTIYLKDFSSPKTVAYKLEQVTVFLDYDEFKRDFELFEADYKNHPPVNIYKRLFKSEMSLRKKSLKLIDNISKKLNQPVNNGDTIVIVHKQFYDGTLWVNDLNNIITSRLQKNNCAVADCKGKLQIMIIRTEGPWNRGGSGGRRYFLPGSDTYFIDQMTWIR